MKPASPFLTAAALLSLTGALGCQPDLRCEGDWCGTGVIVSAAEPEVLFPALATFDVHIAISDLLFWKLADVGLEANTFGDDGFVPMLAESWEFEGPTTISFRINPNARWHDGVPVTAADVAYTFAVFTDPEVNFINRSRLANITSVSVRDSLTAVFEFSRRHPEQFYDAVFHMRVVPHHLLDSIPMAELVSHPVMRNPVGNGPYRFVRWDAGEMIELAGDSAFFAGRPGFRTIVWRFASDQVAMVSQLIAGEADFLNFVPGPENIERVAEQPHLRAEPHKVGVYTFIGFNMRNPEDVSSPHPLLGDRQLRRALSMAIDREAVTRTVVGEYGEVLGLPLTPTIWIWTDEVETFEFDSAAARSALEELGWMDRDGDGVLDRDGTPLAFDLMVPTSSTPRRRAAVIVQDQFKRLGVDMSISELEPTTWDSRALDGNFDAYFQSLGHDASTASIAETWVTTEGMGGLNRIRYSNANVDRLVSEALNTFDRDEARAKWRDALEIINSDAPGIWLFTPIMVAGVHQRFENVSIPADEWWRTIWTWRVSPTEYIDRDLIVPN
jgi:peptide/nickel transport system substrate-binding protein